MAWESLLTFTCLLIAVLLRLLLLLEVYV